MTLGSAYQGPTNPFWMTQDFWDDISTQVTGRQLDSSSGRINYNFATGAIDYQDNARYPDENVGGVMQMKHRWRSGSSLHPHIHWNQNQDAVPNWLLAVKKAQNGAAVPGSFDLYAPSNGNVYTYPGSGSIVQITSFPELDMSGITLSGWVDYFLYRDTGNDSGLFAGTDPYTGDASLRELDFHFSGDTIGSVSPFSKD